MKIAVVGASGHTGRFVVEELLRRGLAPVAVARDQQRLRDRGIDLRQVESRIALLDEPSSLDAAFADATAIVNCAGPFLDTAQPVIEAALRAGAHYFDVTAEQGSVQHTFARYHEPARERGVTVVPAAGFYGALADLLATAAMNDWTAATEIHTAVALDRWWPTLGTRRTGERNSVQRLIVRDGRLEPIDAPSSRTWGFAEPFGLQTVLEVPMSEIILMSRHLAARETRHFINETPLQDLRDAATPEPPAVDERGRSTQTFLMESVVRKDDETRRLVARGRDIYASTAPLVVEAVHRVVRGDFRDVGAFSVAQMFEPMEFLTSLSSQDLTIGAN